MISWKATTFAFTALAILLTGCDVALFATPTSDTAQDWNPLPTYVYYAPTSISAKYAHFNPSESFDFHLEFDYPSHWLFTQHINELGWMSVYLDDPRILTLPTPYPDDHHPTPRDFGDISIWAKPSKPGQTPETELQSHKESYLGVPWRLTVLRDYQTKIDGYDASVLEYQSDDPESSPSLMFIRRIYFMVEGQIYEIYFSVAEKDRGGDFEQGYEHFFNSIKIVP